MAAQPSSIYLWNVNGINATLNKGLFQEFMTEVQPDVVCLNETKATEEKVEKLFRSQIPPNYEQHWNCSKTRKGYSGVAIFTKVKPNSVRHDIKIEKHDQEGRVLTVEFE